MRINWDRYRRMDMTIQLAKAYKENVSDNPEALKYLTQISKLQPIVSRQVAAIAIATAKFIAGDQDV